MPPTPPGEQEQPNRFASVTELAPGDEVWANARGWWRRARVVRVNITTVRVAFRLSRADSLREQPVHLNELRRREPGTRYFQTVPPPTAAELGL